jgi:hypothetical protein
MYAFDPQHRQRLVCKRLVSTNAPGALMCCTAGLPPSQGPMCFQYPRARRVKRSAPTSFANVESAHLAKFVICAVFCSHIGLTASTAETKW